MKIYFYKYFSKSYSVFIIFVSLINFNSNILIAEESYLKNMQIDSSTKSEEKNLGLPKNPFEMVEMIRRANSMNDATKPSDAIDDALKSFDMIEDKERNLIQ